MINIISLALVFQIFVLINPLSSLPVLVSAYENKINVKKLAINAVLLAFIIAAIIAIIGPFLFGLFGITVDSFRVAGGLVLLLLGLDTIRKKELKKTSVGKIDGLISIIATPLLTGPATISFLTIKSYELGAIITLNNLVAAFVLVGIVFVLFSFMIPKINMKIVNIISKVLGLFLTAVAIQMIFQGVLNVFNKIP